MARDLDRPRLRRGDEMLEGVRDRGADEALRHRLARDDDAVAVGDGDRGALGQAALAQFAPEPAEIERRRDDADDPAARVAEGDRQRQHGLLRDPPIRVFPDDEVRAGERLLEIRAVVEAPVGRRRLPTAHLAAPIDRGDGQKLRHPGLQGGEVGDAGGGVEGANGGNLGDRDEKAADAVEDTVDLGGGKAGLAQRQVVDLGPAGPAQGDFRVGPDHDRRQDRDQREEQQASRQGHKGPRSRSRSGDHIPSACVHSGPAGLAPPPRTCHLSRQWLPRFSLFRTPRSPSAARRSSRRRTSRCRRASGPVSSAATARASPPSSRSPPGRSSRTGAADSCSPGATIRYLAQEPDLTAFATTFAFVEAGLGPGDDPYRARHLLQQLGLSGEEEPGRLSGGEARRAALAAVLAPEPDILLLDEPTNHLDLPAIEWLEAELRAMRSALVLISHDRRFLEGSVRGDGLARPRRHASPRSGLCRVRVLARRRSGAGGTGAPQARPQARRRGGLAALRRHRAAQA